jgi:hypothetical protein
MAYQEIGLGSTADDGTGDTIRVGADKVNDNFVEIYTLLGTGSALSSGISATATNITLTSPVIVSSITHADSVKAYYGSSNDLEIYHDGSHTYMKDTGTGHLFISGSQVNLRGSND